MQKKLVLFLFMLLYIVSIFAVKNLLFVVYLLLNIMLIYIYKINVKKAVVNIIYIFPFIIFTAILNTLFTNIESGLIIAIRLILICNITYIVFQTISNMEIVYILEKILKPLKVFGINVKSIGIMVSIAITFIPIIGNELRNIKYVLDAKGQKITLGGVIYNINLIMNVLFVNILKRVGKIENALKAKGFDL